MPTISSTKTAETMATVRFRRLLLAYAAEEDVAADLLAGEAAVLPAGAAALLPAGAAALLADTAPAGAALRLSAVLAEGVSFVFKCLDFFPVLPNSFILPLLPGAFDAFAFSLVCGRQSTHRNALF